MRKDKILALIVSAIYIGSLSPLIASAETTEPIERYGEIIEYIDNEDPATLTDDSYVEPENRVFVSEKSVKDESNGNIMPRGAYGWSEKSTVKQTAYYTKVTTPTGQNVGGTRFSTGGGFYVNKTGGPTATFSVSVAWGLVGFSVDVGSVATNNIGGYYLPAPNKTNYFSARIDRRVRFRRVLVDRYKYGQYQSSYWTTWKDIYSERVYAVRVK